MALVTFTLSLGEIKLGGYIISTNTLIVLYRAVFSFLLLTILIHANAIKDEKWIAVRG